MDGFAAFIVFWVVLFIIIGLFHNKRKKTGKKVPPPLPPFYQAVCEALGTVRSSNYSAGSVYLTGSVHGKKISIKNEENEFPLIQIFLQHGIGAQGLFRVEKESPLSKMKRVVGENDFIIGDHLFDDTMLITATNGMDILALMNDDVREKIKKTAGYCSTLEISNSWIKALVYPVSFPSPDFLVWFINELAEISNNMTTPATVKNKLITNVQSDEEPEVRKNNLRALMSGFRMDNEIKTMLKKALHDMDFSVQIEAAQHLDEEGMKHITSLLKDPVRLNKDDVLKAMEIIGTEKYAVGIPHLIELYNNKNFFFCRPEILEAIKKIGDSVAAGFLLNELETARSDVLIPIIEALGTCGGVDAVEPLYKAGKNSFNPAVRNAVQNSIGKIQARLGNVESGWLTMSDPRAEDGALSFAEDEGKGALRVTNTGNAGIKGQGDDTSQ
jgi:hypothetical protein